MRSTGEIGAALDVRRVPDEPARIEIPAEVRKALGALALAVNHGLTEEQLKVYAYTLRDLEIRWLRAACLELAKTAKFFPKPVEIRECAEGLQRAAFAPPPQYLPPQGGEVTYRCPRCQDARDGWRLVECQGGLSAQCGRRKAHPAHPFAVRCRCWLERHADALRFARQEALKDNTPVPPDCDALEAMEQGRYRW